MSINRPRPRKLHKNVPIPTGFPHFLGYHGTNKVIAAKLIVMHEADVDPDEILGGGEMGRGLYVAATQKDAKGFAKRTQERTGQPWRILRVWRDDATAAVQGEWFDPGDYAELGSDEVCVPDHLMEVTFLRSAVSPRHFKINPQYLNGLRFTEL